MMRKCRGRDLAEVEFTELDPQASRFSKITMDCSQFEVVVHSHGETTLDWVTSLRGTVFGVPIVYFTGTGTEEPAARARRLGAYQVLRQEELKGQRLTQAIEQTPSVSDNQEVDGSEVVLASVPHIDGYNMTSPIGEGRCHESFSPSGNPTTSR